VVNVSDLEDFDAGTKVDGRALKAAGLIGSLKTPVKILGNGQLTKKLTVVADKFSASAAAKIAQAGGTTEQA
jgi:large subunit ribosomal protein L15